MMVEVLSREKAAETIDVDQTYLTSLPGSERFSPIYIRTVGVVNTYQCNGPVQVAVGEAIAQLFDKEDLEKWLADPRSHEADISSLAEKTKNCLMILFPDLVLTALDQFDNMLDPQMLIIKNLPFSGPDSSAMAECFLLGLAALLHLAPFTYKNEHKGRLLHHIKSDVKYENSRTALSSRTELGPHAENAFDPNRPSMMALYCLVGDPGAKTTFYSASKLHSDLDQSSKERLLSVGKENQFVFERPQSHSEGMPGQGALFFDMNNRQLGTRFSSRLTKGLDEDAQKLVLDIEEFLKSENGQLDGYCLEAGDLILWSNYTILHGRSAYEPNYKPDKHRFLVRMYLSNNQNLPILRE